MGSDSPVLLYKPQGTLSVDETPGLSASDFILCLQTVTQQTSMSRTNKLFHRSSNKCNHKEQQSYVAWITGTLSLSSFVTIAVCYGHGHAHTHLFTTVCHVIVGLSLRPAACLLLHSNVISRSCAQK